MVTTAQQFTREDFNRFLAGLKYPPNPFQLQILESLAFGSGNIQVSAVAGSGKTTMIEMLVQSVRFKESITGEKPIKILAMAFNVTIREELSKRLSQYGVSVENSNRLGNSVIFDHLKAEGQKRGAKIDDKKYQDLSSRVLNDIIGRNFETVERDDDGEVIMRSSWSLKHGVASLAEKCLTSFISPDNTEAIWWLAEHHTFDFKGAIEDVRVQVIEDVIPELLKRGRQLWEDYRIISLSEQLSLPITDKMVLPKYDLVLVDEGQDLNLAQQAIAKRCIAEGGRVIVVGDFRQSIMGFSGADDAAWWRMKKVFNSTLYQLNITYRCPVNVVNLARSIVPQLEAREGAPEGTVRQNIHKDELYGLLKADTLILSRMNKDLVETFFELVKEKAKRNDNLTIQVIGRDISNSLSAIVKRIKDMNKDKKRDKDAEFEWAKFNDFVDEYRKVEEERISRMRSETRREDSRTLLDDELQTLMMCHENFQCDSIECFEDKIREVFGSSQKDEDARIKNLHDSVSLCTAHKAKGLEAERVIILAPEKMPLEREHQLAWQLKQELNLLYVAITRSLKDLFVMEGALNAEAVEFDAEAAQAAIEAEQRFAMDAIENDTIPGVNVDKILGIASSAPVSEEPATVPSVNKPDGETEGFETLEPVDAIFANAHNLLKRCLRSLISAKEANSSNKAEFLQDAESYGKDFQVAMSKLFLPFDTTSELYGEENAKAIIWNNVRNLSYQLLSDHSRLDDVLEHVTKTLNALSKQADTTTLEQAIAAKPLSLEEAADVLYSPVQVADAQAEEEGVPIPPRQEEEDLATTLPDRTPFLNELVLLNPELPTDKGMHARAIKVATMLKEAGLWNGETPIRFDNAFDTHKRVVGFEHLPLEKLILTEKDGEILVTLPSDSPEDEKPVAAPKPDVIPTEPVAWAKWMLANKDRVVILDTETTDLPKNRDNFEIVQLSIIDLDGNVLFSEYIKPRRAKITKESAAIHGITDAKLAWAACIGMNILDIEAALKGKHVIAYNSPFDKDALENSLRLSGRGNIEVAGWHCAMRTYTKHNPNKVKSNGKKYGNWKLTEANAQQGLPVDENAHDALADVRMTLALIQSMAQDEPTRWTAPAPQATKEDDKPAIEVGDIVTVKASGKQMQVKKLLPSNEVNLADIENPSSRVTMGLYTVTLHTKAADIKAEEETPVTDKSERKVDISNTYARLKDGTVGLITEDNGNELSFVPKGENTAKTIQRSDLDVVALDPSQVGNLTGKDVAMLHNVKATVLDDDGSEWIDIQPENWDTPYSEHRDAVVAVIEEAEEIIAENANAQSEPVIEEGSFVLVTTPKQANPYNEIESLIRAKFTSYEQVQEFIELVQAVAEDVFAD